MHCNQCGAEGSGRFCGPCGASLVELPCPSCAMELPPGTRFCVACGSPLRGPGGQPEHAPSGAGGGTVLPWAVSGVLLTALLVVAGMTVFSGAGAGGGPGGAQAPPPGTLGAAPNIDLASMSPGEAADRLFNRVAAGLQARDSVEVMNFLPMALDAHELARPLDDGRLFRLSFLQRVATDFDAALETAREGLARSPDHLLLLSAAAEAARELGDEAAARDYYAHLLEVWVVEEGSERQDYLEHPRLLPVIREDAERFLADG